jgi:glycerate-2-kinase
MTEARVICLLMSDVVGDDPSVIASGPFVPDGTTFHDAFAILGKYDLKDKVPPSVMNVIEEGIKGKRKEPNRAGQDCGTQA